MHLKALTIQECRNKEIELSIPAAAAEGARILLSSQHPAPRCVPLPRQLRLVLSLWVIQPKEKLGEVLWGLKSHLQQLLRGPELRHRASVQHQDAITGQDGVQPTWHSTPGVSQSPWQFTLRWALNLDTAAGTSGELLWELS